MKPDGSRKCTIRTGRSGNSLKAIKHLLAGRRAYCYAGGVKALQREFSCTVLPAYDKKHMITYLRLRDADADGASWQEAALLVLHINVD